MYTNDLSIEYADDEQSDILKMFGKSNKGRKITWKNLFLKKV